MTVHSKFSQYWIEEINNFCSYSLGKCLDKKQICDGAPDCQDASDEKSDVCQKHIEMCEAVNATHCQCLLDDMMCGNLKCLHSSKFCDGHDDCGDGSDEPPNCEHDCSLALEAFNQSLICNGKIGKNYSYLLSNRSKNTTLDPFVFSLNNEKLKW